MKRTNVFRLLLGSIFLIVFNVLFFMFVYTKDIKDTVWISYGFILFAYILLLITPLLIRRGSADYIYSRPLHAITTAYFFIELAVGVTLILRFPDNFMLTVTSQVILAAIFLVWLLTHLIANEHTAKSVQQHVIELEYVKESASRIKSISRQVKDQPINKKVEKLYDLIHSSPVKSDYNVYPLEQEIIGEIALLENAVRLNKLEQIGFIADRTYSLAEERNRKLQILNK